MVFLAMFQTCEVAKSGMIKLYLCVSEIMHASKQTKYVHCSLYANFKKYLYMSICFMTKKDHFKQKLLLWP